MKEQGTYKSYTIGLIFCVILTLMAYFVVAEHLLSGLSLVLAVLGIGLVQTILQLVLFLHLGDEPKPYWNLMVFLSMITVLFIIVAGSLWIMYSLNYNTMEKM